MKECIEWKRRRETRTWHSKIRYTQQSRLCSHDETKKSEKGATTGSIIFILHYTFYNNNTSTVVRLLSRLQIESRYFVLSLHDVPVGTKRIMVSTFYWQTKQYEYIYTAKLSKSAH